MANVESITFEPGYLVIQTDSGPPAYHKIADVLRAADIPVLTIASLTLLTDLAQVVSILVQTLIEAKVIDEDDFAEDYDIKYILNTLVDKLSAEFGDG